MDLDRSTDTDHDTDHDTPDWVPCGAAPQPGQPCPIPAAWVDPCGVGWCAEHADWGLYAPPDHLLTAEDNDAN